jgi:hypothetical protein
MKPDHSLRALTMVPVLVVVVAWCPGSVGGTTDVRLSYRTNPVVTLHEPVFLELTIENGRPDRIEVDLGRNYVGELHLSLRRPRGSTISAEPGRVTGLGGLSVRGNAALNAGERHSQQILLNEWFEFPDVGLYGLDVRFSGVIRAASGETVEVPRTGSLGIEVLPRDEDQLRQVCDALLDRVRQSRESDEARDAARALASINDPIVVQYLPAVIKTEIMVADCAIDALQRLGTDEAIWALEEAAKDKRQTVSELAQSALAAIRAKRKDRQP